MNIFKRALRVGLKPFLFWLMGLFMLCFSGIIKFESYSESGGMSELIASFPRIVLSVMGAVGVDIGTLSGYTVLLFYYVLICAVIYAVHLGSSAVAGESVDKTYEFVFTKPRTRSHILSMKLASAYLYFMLLCVFNGLFAMVAVAYLNTSETINGMIWLCVLTVFFIGAMFLAVSAFFASLTVKPEKGTLYGNLAVLYAFILGTVNNMLENPGLLKLITPFNYFSSADLVAEHLDPIYLTITIALTVLLLFGTFYRFNNKDLK